MNHLKIGCIIYNPICKTLYLLYKFYKAKVMAMCFWGSVTIECKYGNRVPKTKIRRKPDSFELVYTKL